MQCVRIAFGRVENGDIIEIIPLPTKYELQKTAIIGHKLNLDVLARDIFHGVTTIGDVIVVNRMMQDWLYLQQQLIFMTSMR